MDNEKQLLKIALFTCAAPLIPTILSKGNSNSLIFSITMSIALMNMIGCAVTIFGLRSSLFTPPTVLYQNNEIGHTFE